MKVLFLLIATLLTDLVHSYNYNNARNPGNKAILLSKVHTLTLQANRITTSRRASPIPQLTCTGPSSRICNLYPIDTMRCTNEGHDYDEEDVQWTCTAPLPEEFKLGSTEVVCEGYQSPEDRWVLRGSCGVEYRLLLTGFGEERFGRLSGSGWGTGLGEDGDSELGFLGQVLFFGVFLLVLGVTIWFMIAQRLGLRRGGVGGPDAGGGGGGPGGPGGGGYPGSPPPYSRFSDSSSSYLSSGGWSPGFWSGALGGAAAGYQFGRNRRQESPFGGRRTGFYDPGEGSSRMRSSPRFSSTATGTGFGSTRRR